MSEITRRRAETEGRSGSRIAPDEGLPTCCQGLFVKSCHGVASAWAASVTDATGREDRRAS
jgi:hypothetical protein